MTLPAVRDPRVVEAAARLRPDLHFYVLGDLDEPYWKASTWWVDSGAPGTLCGLVSGPDFEMPVFYAVAHPDDIEGVSALAGELRDQLPDKMFAHLDPVVARVLAPGYQLTDPLRYEKRVLTQPSRLRAGNPGTVSLGPDDLDELTELYETEPGHGRAFTPTMLATGCYLGVRRSGSLIAVAGVHLFSPKRRVAALGNIFTHPDHRGAGLARLVTSALCHRLDPAVDTIGLNVSVENEPARRCYSAMGFEISGTYLEGVLQRSTH